MIVIWKFSLEEILQQSGVMLPKNAQILSVQYQDDKPCVWAMVDSDAPREQRRFLLYGTGHPIKEHERLKFIGTIQRIGLVGHLFEFLTPNI
jgi:hypothetical protein